MGYYLKPHAVAGCAPKTANPRSARAVSGQRFYSASLGRWLSRDPLGEYGGCGLYTVVGNNPVKDYDYLGMSIFSKRRCNKMKENFVKQYADQIAGLQLLGCLSKEDPITCDDSTDEGGYVGDKITIGCQGDSATPEWLWEQLVHEMNHATACGRKDPKPGEDSCEQRICNELRASYCGKSLPVPGKANPQKDTDAVYNDAVEGAVASSTVYCCSKKFGTMKTPEEEAALREKVRKYAKENCPKPTSSDCWFTHLHDWFPLPVF